MLHALLFDMNGVVVDDMAYHERAWIALAERHGRTLTVDDFRSQMSGRRNRDNIHHIFGNDLSEARIREYQIEKESAYRDAFRPHLAPLPGLVDLLTAARAAKLKIALVTSAPQVNIDFVLDGLTLRGHFDVVVSEAEVKESKPDPEIYLLAASRVGAKPSECIVFEDSLAGIASGRAAKMPVVGLTTTHAAAELHDCALVVPDFRGLTVADLERVVSPSE